MPELKGSSGRIVLRGSASLAFLTLLLSAGRAQAAEPMVVCGVYQGSNCEVKLYEFGMCRFEPARPDRCVRICQQLRPICRVQDFAPWVAQHRAVGERGFEGELLANADDFDDDGRLHFLAGRRLSVCMSGPMVRQVTGQAQVTIATIESCPSPSVGNVESCRGGTVLNPVTRRCEIRDPGCGSGAGAIADAILEKTEDLVRIQNAHFTGGLAPDPRDRTRTAAVTVATGVEGVAPGMTDPRTGQGARAGVTTVGVIPEISETGGARNSSAATLAGAAVAGPVPASGAGSASAQDLVFSGKKNTFQSASGLLPDSSSGFGPGVSTSDWLVGGSNAAVGAYATAASGIATSGEGNSTSDEGYAVAALQTSRRAALLSTANISSDSSVLLGSKPSLETPVSFVDGATRGEKEIPREISSVKAAGDADDYFARVDPKLSLFKRVTAQFRKKEALLSGPE